MQLFNTEDEIKDLGEEVANLTSSTTSLIQKVNALLSGGQGGGGGTNLPPAEAGDVLVKGPTEEWVGRHLLVSDLPQETQNLEPRLNTLSARVDSIAAGSNTTAINNRLDTLSSRIDSIVAGSNSEQVINRLDTLSSRMDSIAAGSNTTAINNRLDTLSSRMDSIAAGSNTTAINNRLDTLSSRMDSIAAGSNTTAINNRLDTLSSGLQTLTNRVDTLPSGGGSTTIPQKLIDISNLSPAANEFLVGNGTGSWASRKFTEADLASATIQKLTGIETSIAQLAARKEILLVKPATPQKSDLWWNEAAKAFEYFDGTKTIQFTASGPIDPTPGKSWAITLPITSAATLEADKYYELDGTTGLYEIKLPNPVGSGKVYIKGRNNNSGIYINPNGKNFMGLPDRRIYTGTTPVTLTYTNDTLGWTSDVDIPKEVIVVPPPADTTLFLRLKNTAGIVKTVAQGMCNMWSGEANSNSFDFAPISSFGDESITSSAILDGNTTAYARVELNSINNRSSVRIRQGGYYAGLSDVQVPNTPRKYTLFIVANVDDSSKGSWFFSEFAYYKERKTWSDPYGTVEYWQEGYSRGFQFANRGIIQYPLTAGAGAPPLGLVYPKSKMPPNNVFTVYIYQIDYDSSIWTILDSKGNTLSVGGFSSTNNDGQRAMIIGDNLNNMGTGSFYYPLGVEGGAKSEFRLAEIRMYNNLLIADQIAAVCTELKTFHALSYMI